MDLSVSRERERFSSERSLSGRGVSSSVAEITTKSWRSRVRRRLEPSSHHFPRILQLTFLGDYVPTSGSDLSFSWISTSYGFPRWI